MKMEANENPNDITGFTPIDPGRYCVEIADVDDTRTVEVRESDGKLRCCDVLKLRILSGEISGHENKELKVFMDLKLEKDGSTFTEGDIHRKWAYAAGLLNPGQTIDFKPYMLRGCTVIVNITKDKSGKYANVGNWGYDVWRIGDPAVAGVPTAVSSRDEMDGVL